MANLWKNISNSFVEVKQMGYGFDILFGLYSYMKWFSKHTKIPFPSFLSYLRNLP